MDRVLILTADSGEELEVYYMLYRLREAGYEVDVAAPQRKRLALVVHDFKPGADTYVERPGRGLDADLAFSEVDPEQYVALLIPGGRAPEVIRNDPDVRRIVSHFFENDLPVGHMCHGVQVPAAFGYVRGRACLRVSSARDRGRGGGRRVRRGRRRRRRDDGFRHGLDRPRAVVARVHGSPQAGRGARLVEGARKSPVRVLQHGLAVRDEHHLDREVTERL